MSDCQAAGWRIALLYLWLPSVEVALGRVARRVRHGGHDVPTGVVARRYTAGLRNMRSLYLPLAYSAAVYDNSDEGLTLIASRADGLPLVIHDAVRWARIEKATR